MPITIKSFATGSFEWRQHRYDRMVALREEGMTLGDIGRAMDPPLTKQRVQSILQQGRPTRPGGRPRRQPLATQPEEVA